MSDDTANRSEEQNLLLRSWTDLLAGLRVQHQVAEGRFAALETALTTGGPAAESRMPAAVDALLAYADGDLAAHIRDEEELLFPRLRGAVPPWDQHLIDQVMAGHDQIRRKRDGLRAAATAQVRGAPPGERQAMYHAARELLQALLTHIENEEDLIFPLASAVPGADARSAVSGASGQRPMRTRPGETHSATTAIALSRAVALLQTEEGWQRGDYSSATLAALRNLRVILTAMRGGARLALHETSARFTLQVLSGRVAIHTRDQLTELPAGHLLALDRNIPHDVEALVDSAFLVSLVGAEGEGTSAGRSMVRSLQRKATSRVRG